VRAPAEAACVATYCSLGAGAETLAQETFFTSFQKSPSCFSEGFGSKMWSAMLGKAAMEEGVIEVEVS